MKVLKYLGYTLAVFLGLIYMTMVVILNLYEYKYCDYYTKEMNGGVRQFDGRSYRIELCGTDPGLSVENGFGNLVRLQVFSMSGELWAERIFKPSLLLKELDYEANHLIYYAGTGPDGENKISMPPGWLDWIRSRMPRMWPTYQPHEFFR